MVNYLRYLRESEMLLEQEAAALKSSGRTDESKHALIRRNIYGICKSVYETYSVRFQANELSSAYSDKLSQLEAAWQTACIQAKMHDNFEQEAIEQIKIAVLQEIRNQYREME